MLLFQIPLAAILSVVVASYLAIVLVVIVIRSYIARRGNRVLVVISIRSYIAKRGNRVLMVIIIRSYIARRGNRVLMVIIIRSYIARRGNTGSSWSSSLDLKSLEEVTGSS